MATRSWPTPSCRPVSIARRSFVPTPSVPATSTGRRQRPSGISIMAPKPPMPARTSGRIVRATRGRMRSTSSSPASMSTPASRYVSEGRSVIARNRAWLDGPVRRAVYYCSVSARPDLAPTRPCRAWLLVLLLALVGGPARAETLQDLYSVTVPYAGDNEAAFREAMRAVLVRVTGQSNAPELENLQPLVAQASNYVKSFRRAAGNHLTVSFDGPAIENADDASGLAFWGNERPVTLVWLVLDRGGGRRALVSSSDSSAEKALVDASASRRGLPIVWLDAGDDLVSAMQQAWSGNHADRKSVV